MLVDIDIILMFFFLFFISFSFSFFLFIIFFLLFLFYFLFLFISFSLFFFLFIFFISFNIDLDYFPFLFFIYENIKENWQLGLGMVNASRAIETILSGAYWKMVSELKVFFIFCEIIFLCNYLFIYFIYLLKQFYLVHIGKWFQNSRYFFVSLFIYLFICF